MKLKSCPFCGGEARYLPLANGWKMVDCIVCGAAVKEFTSFIRDVKTKWNHRVVEPTPESNRDKRVPIPGHPGLYTFTNIKRDPVHEKQVVDKIMKDAERIRIQKEIAAKGGVITVKFGRKIYPTKLDSQGVQRFISDPQKCADFDAGDIDLNQMGVDVIEGRMKKIDFIELRMSLGMSVSGMMDAYPYFTVKNPLWGD